MQYIGTILQFDKTFNFVQSFSGELETILSQLEDGGNYYYRFPAFSEVGNRERIRYSHFGLNGINVSCNNYNAEELLHFCLNYNIQKYYRKKHENKIYHIGFDNPVFAYTMQLQEADRLKKNTSQDFNERLNSFLSRHPQFIQIQDLNDYINKKGLYILVLDKYNVCYIGQAQRSIATRVKQHWSKSNYFQRGIDRFKSLDTTRIYVYPISEVDRINIAEYEIIPDFPEQYTLNCGNSGGDVVFMNNHKPLDNIEPVNKKRNLLEYIYISEKILGISKV